MVNLSKELWLRLTMECKWKLGLRARNSMFLMKSQNSNLYVFIIVF